jgi:putative DNA primase/helicase
MPGAMAEYGKEYENGKQSNGIRSNVTLHDDSEDWMPSCQYSRALRQSKVID